MLSIFQFYNMWRSIDSFYKQLVELDQPSNGHNFANTTHD